MANLSLEEANSSFQGQIPVPDFFVFFGGDFKVCVGGLAVYVEPLVQALECSEEMFPKIGRVAGIVQSSYAYSAR